MLNPRQVTPALLQVDAILSRLSGRAALAEVCRFLRQEFRHYPWVGIYRREGPLLRLAAYDGPQPTEHETIPIGQGVCGRAAREARSIVVADVRTAPEYLACFRETRAEVVVPVGTADGVLGEIDIDGNEVNAFDASDVAFLEQVAGRLARVLADVAIGPA
ncbi:MAG TPA: GAF domain-containing protein [Thermoplasmata archaeon]|nr:GAF domain-containing protein [Thermoplasmata archaeon]